MLYGLLLGAVGGALTGLIALIGQIIAKRYEAKSRFREMAIQAGLDMWKFQSTAGIEEARRAGSNYQQGTPETYVCHMLDVFEIAADLHLRPGEAAKRIKSDAGRSQ